MKKRITIRTKIGCLLAGFICLIGITACEDPVSPAPQTATESEGVPVTISIGFDDETEDYTYTPSTRSNTREAFTVEHGTVQTRDMVVNALKPDQLYYLEVQQYKQDGTLLQNNIMANKAIAPGSKLSLTLTPTTNGEYCQLVIVARGAGQAVASLKDKKLSEVQDGITVESSVIDKIDYSADGIKNMPYVLHLKQVQVVQEDGTYKIQSPEGSYDTRLLLKRLAARLTVNWDYNVKDYALKQVLIQSVPLEYAVVDKPETDGTYPSIISQFTTLVVPGVTNKGSYSCWLPANVRGEKAAATSEIQRSKTNSPIGGTYCNFIAVNDKSNKTKLDYRVYIGSGSSTDFNIYKNKEYNYTVNFNHTSIPINDKRVTYIDPIRASESNDNLVPTANCFMVEPGGAFCFDPFAYQQNGTEITNTVMTGWYNTAGTGIKSVKLLWQTRENGDVGDPVMGIANSDNDDDNDHTNIVDIKRTDGKGDISTTPANDKGQCRIYCRVAANTTGGNGVIAAYDTEGNIAWSWHVWVTDYTPSATGTAEEYYDDPKRRKLLFSYNNSNVLPMMDRNLGALAGYVEKPPTTYQDKSKANGLHYQWGRKDPFPSSYTEQSISKITNKDAKTPPKGMQNRYGADGITYIVNESSVSLKTLREVCQTPIVFYAKEGNSTDYGLTGIGPSWANDDAMQEATWDNNLKTFWDPSPAGWRVPSESDLKAIIATQNNAKNMDSQYDDGGYMVYYQANGSGHSNYFRFTGYGRFFSTFEYINTLCSIWSRTDKTPAEKQDSQYGYAILLGKKIFSDSKIEILYQSGDAYKSDAQTLRCIQERQ